MVFGHFRRVLRPNAPPLLGFHLGDESRLKTQGYGGHPMNVYVHRRQPGQVVAWLSDAGFTIEAQMLLDPDDSAPGRSFSHDVTHSSAALSRSRAPTTPQDHQTVQSPWAGWGDLCFASLAPATGRS